MVVLITVSCSSPVWMLLRHVTVSCSLDVTKACISWSAILWGSKRRILEMFLRWNMHERHRDLTCASILSCSSKITPTFLTEVLNGIGWPSIWTWTRSETPELARGALTKTIWVLSPFNWSLFATIHALISLTHSSTLSSVPPHSQGVNER